jgi:hypothetical protein
MEDKFIKRVQQDINSTKNPVIINNDDTSSKNSKNSKYKKDIYKKNRFLDEISDSEEDEQEVGEEGDYEFKDEFREKVVAYVKSDDKIRELQKLVNDQKKIKKDCEEAILRHLERLGENMINISGGKIRKNQYESRGALKKEFIKESILEKIKDPKAVEDILTKMEEKRELKVNISLKRTFERENAKQN